MKLRLDVNDAQVTIASQEHYRNFSSGFNTTYLWRVEGGNQTSRQLLGDSDWEPTLLGAKRKAMEIYKIRTRKVWSFKAKWIRVDKSTTA